MPHSSSGSLRLATGCLRGLTGHGIPLSSPHLRKNTAVPVPPARSPWSPIRSRVALCVAYPTPRHCPLSPEDLIASPLDMRQARRGPGRRARDPHPGTHAVHRLPPRHRAPRACQWSAEQKRCGIAGPFRLAANLTALGRSRTVRPDRVPTEIFHGGCPPELESRLERQRSGGGPQRPSHPAPGPPTKDRPAWKEAKARRQRSRGASGECGRLHRPSTSSNGSHVTPRPSRPRSIATPRTHAQLPTGLRKLASRSFCAPALAPHCAVSEDSSAGGSESVSPSCWPGTAGTAGSGRTPANGTI